MNNQDLQTLLAKKKELVEITAKLDQYTTDLLNTKRELVDQIDELMERTIKPLKEEISQIDAEIETVMRETGTTKLTTDTYGAYLSHETTITITDRLKAWQWINQHPEVLKKDILKTSEVNKLINDGVVPDPEADGIDCSNSYSKVSYRRK